ncbi:head-tail connector protein [Clostridium formicaceticum]|uniref:DNA packaging protein n=1 Tax=Clostridium formicaceticum TaxID=1497 RepID=A0AAC9RMN8_9CLOT|nr:head-tail connector protein [Clostridium formicaceticum]AOY76679.1 DNA packaging protein [Clostridium formicaceticum]ARE87110.1 Phage gp6-like head-tail connector protein [Clostridium formicaceticum]
MILDLQQTKNWLRVDGDEEDTVIETLIAAAELYLKNMTGIEFDSTNKLAKLLCMTLVSDWYENRALVTVAVGPKTSEKMRRTIESMLLQLQYCYPREGEE